MKHYIADEIRLLAVIPGKLKSSLRLLDHLNCSEDELFELEEILRKANVFFISTKLANGMGIYDITILSGIDSFIAMDKEARENWLNSTLSGIQNVANGDQGMPRFEKRELLIDELYRRNNTGFLQAVRKYLSVYDPAMLENYETQFIDIIATIK